MQQHVTNDSQDQRRSCKTGGTLIFIRGKQFLSGLVRVGIVLIIHEKTSFIKLKISIACEGENAKENCGLSVL